MKTFLGLVALLSIVLLGIAQANTVSIYAPAVLGNELNGTITTITLNLTPGNGAVSVVGPAEVANSTLQSAQTAVQYAQSYLGVTVPQYNFTYTIHSNGADVSGPSAGLAFTILAISAMTNQTVPSDFTVTGTISLNGTVGAIGGVYDKAGAASRAGLKYILVPAYPVGAPGGLVESLIYLIAQHNYDIPLVEVANVSQALPYVYGTATPMPLTVNDSTDYHTSQLPDSSLTCQCNLSGFYNLTDFTLQFTRQEVLAINPAYSGVRSQMLATLANLSVVESKGYLYTAADEAYTTYIPAALLVNSGTVTKSSVSSVLENVSAFCASLTPPPLTNTNYEYVIGGELRQSWGQYSIGQAAQALNQSQTSDDLLTTLYSAEGSNAWCLASNKMYQIAQSLGGTYVATGPTVQDEAESLIAAANKSSTDIYLQTAISDYAQGEYGAALYNIEYHDAFQNTTVLVGTRQQQASALNGVIAGSTYGAWPTEFAAQSQFLEEQANFTNSSYESAYTLAILASHLNKANELINSTFSYNVTYPTTIPSYATSEQLAAIQNKLDTLTALMAVEVLLIVILLVLLLIVLLNMRKQSPAPEPKRRSPRQRR